MKYFIVILLYCLVTVAMATGDGGGTTTRAEPVPPSGGPTIPGGSPGDISDGPTDPPVGGCMATKAQGIWPDCFSWYPSDYAGWSAPINSDRTYTPQCLGQEDARDDNGFCWQDASINAATNIVYSVLFVMKDPDSSAEMTFRWDWSNAAGDGHSSTGHKWVIATEPFTKTSSFSQQAPNGTELCEMKDAGINTSYGEFARNPSSIWEPYVCDVGNAPVLFINIWFDSSASCHPNCGAMLISQGDLVNDIWFTPTESGVLPYDY